METLKREYTPEKIILFGSVARGEESGVSDVDLAVIKKTNKPFPRRLMDMADYTAGAPFDIEILVYTPDEWSQALQEDNYFIKEIINTGRILYERPEKQPA